MSARWPKGDATVKNELSLSQLVAWLESAGAVVLRWRPGDGASPLPHTLILPPPPSLSGSATLSAVTWYGASVVRLLSPDADTDATTVVLAPACLRAFPFRLPCLPQRMRSEVLEGGGFASLSGPGYGPWDVGARALGSVDAAGGAAGVVLLKGKPSGIVLEAVSGSFPLFQAAADPEAPCVLPADGCDGEDRKALMRRHWARLKAFLPSNLVGRLTNAQTEEEADGLLQACVWCTVRYPDGDPFCHGTNASTAASAATATVRTRAGRYLDVLLPEGPYYLLPDFLLMRYATPCIGPRGVEPRLRARASAGAADVRALLAKAPNPCRTLIEEEVAIPMGQSALLQAASALPP